MKNENLVRRIGEIAREIERLDKENPTGPDEATDPRILELFIEGDEIQKELDVMVRGILRDYPEKLVVWDSIMHMCDEPDEKS
jgi:hypothetical protein